MAIKHECDGCGVDITTKVTRGESGDRSAVVRGAPGDGMPREISVGVGSNRIVLNLCSTCLTSACLALVDSLSRGERVYSDAALRTDLREMGAIPR